VLSWSTASGSVDPEVVGVIREVRRTAVVALLSNATSRLPDDLVRLGLDDEFDVVFNTAEIGVAKPAREVFLEVLRRLGSVPEECALIDDSPSHVLAAAQVGMHAHRFSDTAALRAFLLTRGLLGGRIRNLKPSPESFDGGPNRPARPCGAGTPTR
jgi:putative hydrolase of the HAD superfamily